MILKIEKYGSEKLRTPAQKVAVTAELAVLAEDMLETMYKAKGVGLAAEQVGRTEALCVIDVPLSCEDDEETKQFNAGIVQPLVMFNPEIVSILHSWKALFFHNNLHHRFHHQLQDKALHRHHQWLFLGLTLLLCIQLYQQVYLFDHL